MAKSNIPVYKNITPKVITVIFGKINNKTPKTIEIIFTIKEIDKNRIVLLHLKKGFENEDEKGEEKHS